MEKLFAKIKKETLNPDEKAEILSNLQIFMKENPVQEIRSPFYNPWLVFLRHKNFIVPAVALVVIVSMTGGTVLAAKNSLPGDKLYTIKILNENVQTFMAVDTEAKAEIEVSHAISRLQEVEQIVSQKRQLGKGEGKTISNKFETQVQNATAKIDELKNSGQRSNASKIQSDFKTRLAEHEKKITDLLTDTDVQVQNKEELSHVFSNVRSQIEKSEKESKSNSRQKGRSR
jgi:hypothetical protein